MKTQKKTYARLKASVFRYNADVIRTSLGGAEAQSEEFTSQNTTTDVGTFY